MPRRLCIEKLSMTGASVLQAGVVPVDEVIWHFSRPPGRRPRRGLVKTPVGGQRAEVPTELW